MFGSLRRLFSKSYVYGLFSALGTRMGQWSKRDFLGLFKEGYKINPVAYACIDEIAKAVGGIQWKIYKPPKDDSAEREEITEGELVELLKKPNTSDTWGELQDHGMRDFLIGGNQYYILIDRNLDWRKPISGPVIGMWQVHPNTIRPAKGVMGVAHWIIRENGKEDREVDPSRIIHIKTYNAEDDSYGMSPLEAAARDVDTMNEALKFKFNTYKNGGQPAGLVLVEGGMGQADKEKAQADVDKGFNDPTNAGRWKLITGAKNFKFEKLAATARDLESSKGRLENTLAICSVFGVPPEVIGMGETKTFNNYKEARKALYEETIMPLLDIRREKYQRHLIDDLGLDLIIDYDVSEVEALKENENEKVDRAGRMIESSLATANEARKKVGLPPAEDPLANSRMIKLGVTAADAEPMDTDGDDIDNEDDDPKKDEDKDE